MKKYLFLLFAVSSFLILTACSNQIKPTTVPTNATVLPTLETASPTPTQPVISGDVSKLAGLQIFFMHPWSGETATLMDSLAAEFNRTNSWGIRVNVVAPGSEGAMMDQVLADMQNSLPPEVVAAPVDELLSLNRNSETVADLTPYVNSSDWGLGQDIIQNFAPIFWNQDIKNNYRLGIPAQRTAKVLIYNNTWATELGFSTPPASADEFEQQVCAAHASLKLDKDTSNDGLGGWVTDTDAMTLDSWAAAFGATLEKNGSLVFSSDEMNNAFTYLRKLLDEGCAWNSKDVAPYPLFAKRQTLAYSASLQEMQQQQLAMQIAGNSDEWLVIPFPGQQQPTVVAYGPSFAMFTSTPEKQLASWLFIRWMSSADHLGAIVKSSASLPMGNALVNYSIELEDSLPQWAQAVQLLPLAQVPPQDGSWPTAKMVLEDAGWQLFKTNQKADQIPALIKQIDDTLKELTGKAQ